MIILLLFLVNISTVTTRLVLFRIRCHRHHWLKDQSVNKYICRIKNMATKKWQYSHITPDSDLNIVRLQKNQVMPKNKSSTPTSLMFGAAISRKTAVWYISLKRTKILPIQNNLKQTVAGIDQEEKFWPNDRLKGPSHVQRLRSRRFNKVQLVVLCKP